MTLADIIRKHNFHLCSAEAAAQKMGFTSGCEDSDCQFAHSVPEATQAFHSCLAAVRKFTQNAKSTLFVYIASEHMNTAAKFGGRQNKPDGPVSLMFPNYLMWFNEYIESSFPSDLDEVYDQLLEEPKSDDEGLTEEQEAFMEMHLAEADALEALAMTEGY